MASSLFTVLSGIFFTVHRFEWHLHCPLLFHRPLLLVLLSFCPVYGPQRLIACFPLVFGPFVVLRVGPVGVDLRRMGIMQRRRAVREKSLVFQKRFARKFVVIGVDRCVQTSGIVQKLMAFEEFLLRNSKLSEFVVLVQIVLPTNSSTVEEEGSTDGHPRGLGRSIEGGGRQLRRRIDQVVGRTNARFANITSTSRPIYCLHQELESDDLLSLYETADCVLVTPIKEGMNTVPFEYLVCRDNRGLPGTVIVSEFAGCASSLSGAILVNPGKSHRVRGVILLLAMSSS